MSSAPGPSAPLNKGKGKGETFELDRLPSRSDFGDRRQRRRRQIRHDGSSIADRKGKMSEMDVEASTQQGLLQLLRVVIFYKVRVMSIKASQGWHLRQALGEGATFAVEEATLSNITQQSLHETYRGLKTEHPEDPTHFYDHTGTPWSWQKDVAFKSVSDQPQNMSDLAQELLVYCHRPLQKHPNIVRLLCVAFYTNEDTSRYEAFMEDYPVPKDADLQVNTLLVIERAPHASLETFLESIEFTQVRSSVTVKFRLGADVMCAIEALHACGIFHGDIKLANVLVFESGVQEAEGWTAKLTDFGHSKLCIDNESDVGNTTYNGGTRFYDAPEVACPIDPDFSCRNWRSIDIWSWGVLFWQLMVADNTCEVCRHVLGRSWRSSDAEMQEYRLEGRVLEKAQDACQNYLSLSNHGGKALERPVLRALGDSLCTEPTERKTAACIYTALKEAIDDNLHYHLKPSPIKSLHDLPFFDLSGSYYKLSAIFMVPNRVYEELEAICQEQVDEHALEATYQIGLCHAVGFGTQRNYRIALDMVLKAAMRGHEHAQAVSSKVATAFGINLSHEEQEIVTDGLRQAVKRGSFIASQCLNVSNLRIESHIEQEGSYGATPLHWATLLPHELSRDKIQDLLDSGWFVWNTTKQEVPISPDPTIVEIMPANTTPMDWAVIVDNLPALDLMMTKSTVMATNKGIASNSKRERSTMSQLSYAASYQSISCLKYLCEKDKGAISKFDTFDRSPLYYAIRPNVLDRILRYQPEAARNAETSQHTKEAGKPNLAPVVAREIMVIDTLRNSGSKLIVQRYHGYFNCLHISAATAEFEVLEYLLNLEADSVGQLINETTAFGRTPLDAAIGTGRIHNAQILLQHLADSRGSFPDSISLAIYVCCEGLGQGSVKIAQILIEIDPGVLQLRDRCSSSPLHKAAENGHSGMIALLLHKGANPMELNSHLNTPLGSAITQREVAAVALISSHLRKNKLPFKAVRGDYAITIPGITRASFLGLFDRYISAFDYLLMPGKESPKSTQRIIRHDYIPLQREWSHSGTFDVPFSKVSLRILGILIDNYAHHTRFGVNSFLSMTRAVYRYDSGLRWAVRMANPRVVSQYLHPSRKESLLSLDPNFRDLLELAYTQRTLGQTHVASEQAREATINLLREHQRTEFQFNRTKRTQLFNLVLLKRFWRLYYLLYGDLEQDQYERANDWSFENRPKADSKFLEFHQWFFPRLCLDYVILIFLWTILTALIVAFVVLARDSASKITARNVGYLLLTIIATNFLSLWVKIFRVIYVLFDAVYGKMYETFPGEDWPRTAIQVTMCVCVLYLGLSNMFYLLEPDTKRLIRFDPWPHSTWHRHGAVWPLSLWYVNDWSTNYAWNGLELGANGRIALICFHHLCRILMAWMVFVTVIPAGLFIETRIVKWAETFWRIEKKTDPRDDRDPYNDEFEPSYRFGSRRFWLLTLNFRRDNI